MRTQADGYRQLRQVEGGRQGRGGRRGEEEKEGRDPGYKAWESGSPGCIQSARITRAPNQMEVQRSVGPQQTNSGSGMCESAQRSCEPRRKRTEERSGAPSELARIITDPATGKCYCRGKVLGKVAHA